MDLEWDEDLVELVNRPKEFIPRIKYQQPSETFYKLSTTEKAERNKPKHIVKLKKIKVFVQSLDKDILDLAYGTVYNMLLHDETWLKWIKRHDKPFLLVHGGFQGQMAPVKEIIEFSLRNKPDLIIAPDVYKNQPETTRLTQIFVEKAPEKIMKKTAAVLQCKVSEYLTIAKMYEDLGFKWIAIPSDSRVIEHSKILKELGWKIHILGNRDVKLLERDFDSVDIVTNDYTEFMRFLAWKQERFDILTE